MPPAQFCADPGLIRPCVVSVLGVEPFVLFLSFAKRAVLKELFRLAERLIGQASPTQIDGERHDAERDQRDHHQSEEKRLIVSLPPATWRPLHRR